MQPRTARPRRAKLTAWQLAALEKLIWDELGAPRSGIEPAALHGILDKLAASTGEG